MPSFRTQKSYSKEHVTEKRKHGKKASPSKKSRQRVKKQEKEKRLFAGIVASKNNPRALILAKKEKRNVFLTI